MIRSTTLANILHLIRDRHIDLIEIQDNDVGFPLPEAANTTMQKDYKCCAAFGTGPIAFLARNNLAPHILEVIYSHADW